MREISVWEGIGSISLLGLCVSGLYSLSSFAKYTIFCYTHTFSASELALKATVNEKLVHVKSRITPADSSIVAYLNKSTTTTVSTGIANVETQTSVMSMKISNFYLDIAKTVKVRPDIDTVFNIYSEKVHNPPSKFDRVLSFIELPLIFIKLVLGIRRNFSTTENKQSLVANQSVFIVGKAKLKDDIIEIIPSIVSNDKSSIERAFYSAFVKSLILPAIFAIGLLVTYWRIKKLTRGMARKDEAISAQANMLCAVCKTRPCELVAEPCNHLSLCSDCNPNQSHCPICRKAIITRFKIFSG